MFDHHRPSPPRQPRARPEASSPLRQHSHFLQPSTAGASRRQASSNATSSSSLLTPSVAHPQPLGTGVPGFQTSFNVSGKGGGAFRPISESFQVNPATGTLTLSVPIRTSPSRGGFGPELALSYDSGAGNGPFGFGWGLHEPSFSRKISRGVPRYENYTDAMVFGGTDIVPALITATGKPSQTRTVSTAQGDFRVTQWRPRVDTQATRIEQWTNSHDVDDVHWRTISADNVTTIYGEDGQSRIWDHPPACAPGGRSRIFSWLRNRSYDAWGNAIEYLYQSENSMGIADANGSLPVWEQNRTPEARARQRYLKRIQYGNRVPNRDLASWEATNWPNEWMFELVFDYGDHRCESPATQPDQQWPVRKDPFSQASAGFEVRSYRLCRRILMFHHFPEQIEASENLVASTDLDYEESPHGTMLKTITACGYSIKHSSRLSSSGPERDEEGRLRYGKESLPPWSFQYSQLPDLTQTEAMAANVATLAQIPNTGSVLAEWLDLDGEGIPGLLTRLRDGTLFYQRNNGSSFAPPHVLPVRPSLTAGAEAHFQDLDQNGRLDLVCTDADGRIQGYHERENADSWSEYSVFSDVPTESTVASSMISIDLTGDGLADLLGIGPDGQELIWRQNLGKRGYSKIDRCPSDSSPQHRPRLNRDGDSQTHILDMTGDGLSDLVEISANRIMYWPNHGHGVFGAPVEMGNSPALGLYGEYDPQRVRLMDIDGSGTTDLLYLLSDGGCVLFYNLSGNAWSPAVSVIAIPRLVDPSSVFVLDLFGSGTGCLCWADASTASGNWEVRYINLMGNSKPHLLQQYSTGLGAVTTVSYTPSTGFYLHDLAQGQPWTTRLPFPVQCISQVEIHDAITGNRSTTRYRYHNGSYDGVERQFAGFEMVETLQEDHIVVGAGETFAGPVKHVKSWYHVGQVVNTDETHFLAPSLVKTVIDCNIEKEDLPQAYRALRGSKTRVETYSRDDTDREEVPYEVAEFSYEIHRLQPRDTSPYAVFQVTPCESLITEYDRRIGDGRITHQIALKVNPFGDVEETLTVIYPRTGVSTETMLHKEVEANQKAGNVTFARSWFTGVVDETFDFRKPQPRRHQKYAIFGLTLPHILKVSETRNMNLHLLPDSLGGDKVVWKSLRTDERVQLRNVGSSQPLSEGDLGAFSVLDCSFSLAFTPKLIQIMEEGQRECGATATHLNDLLTEAGYVELDSDGNWWAQSQRIMYSASQNPCASELDEARRNFYSPRAYVDVFGNKTSQEMDMYSLMVKSMEDAMGNKMLFTNNYEQLQPETIIDHNQNVQQAIISPLGQTTAVALLGKGNELERDSLDGVEAEVSPADIDALLADPSGAVTRRLLGNASTRSIFFFDRFQRWLPTGSSAISNTTSTCPCHRPAGVIELARDRSSYQSPDPTIRVTVNYLTGFGEKLQMVTLSEPTDPEKRWLVGEMSLGAPSVQVSRNYEPYFTPEPTFVPPNMMDGCSTTIFYDPHGRRVATLEADHTWSKAAYTPWSWTTNSAGDRLLCNPLEDPDVGYLFSRIAFCKFLPTWYDLQQKGSVRQREAAAKSMVYTESVSVTHLGSCGLPLREIQMVKDTSYTREFAYDFSGNRVRSIDSLGRLVERRLYNKLGSLVMSFGMDSGQVWALQDAQEHPILSFNSRGVSFQSSYDALRRETERFMRQGAQPRSLVLRLSYQDSQSPSAAAKNICGQIWKIHDQSGIHTNECFDIRGRCIESAFQPAKEYNGVVDWQTDPAVEQMVFRHRVSFDHFDQAVTEEDVQGNRTCRQFSRLGQLRRVDFRHHEAEDWQSYLVDATHAADGLPLRVKHGNGVTTDYTYETGTRRLLSQRTFQLVRGRQMILQDLRNTYDCAGRRVHTIDASEQTAYFRNCRVDPVWEYTYDSIGQLVQARGRAQLPSSTGKGTQLQPHSAATGMIGVRGVADGNQLYQYQESYEYDQAGNIISMKHEAPFVASISGWTRSYFYEEPSLLSSDPSVTSNRLSRTSIGTRGLQEERYGYGEDAGRTGCITSFPQFSRVTWNMHNMMASTSTQNFTTGTPETTYYVYDWSGNRVRKVTVGAAAAKGTTAQRQRDTLYLHGVEIQIQFRGDGTTTRAVRSIAQVTSNHDVLALVESTDQQESDKALLIRYQTSDHLELDEAGQLISYEEYSPFGTVLYSAMHQRVEASRIYRFARYEHDRESGLYHCGARYYSPWLGRWLSPDPLGDVDGPNLYVYVANDPVNLDDPAGTCINPDKKSLPALKLDAKQGTENLNKAIRNVSVIKTRLRHVRNRSAFGHSESETTRKANEIVQKSHNPNFWQQIKNIGNKPKTNFIQHVNVNAIRHVNLPSLTRGAQEKIATSVPFRDLMDSNYQHFETQANSAIQILKNNPPSSQYSGTTSGLERQLETTMTLLHDPLETDVGKHWAMGKYRNLLGHVAANLPSQYGRVDDIRRAYKAVEYLTEKVEAQTTRVTRLETNASHKVKYVITRLN